ncbi:MAG: NUDIX hydrolase [Nitrospirae bacterium]|nr:MAG: NUDIX hydrolase [Nitrospirota bacterium]
MSATPILYCSHCGAKVEYRIPPGETVVRAVCPACHIIHYQNPKIVAGCIVEWQGDILLCRRAIEPRRGLWTIPAGFMELGESTEEAAARETLEEAKAVVDIYSLYAVFSLPHVGQVYVVFRGRLRTSEYGVGEESLEVQMTSLDKIPWNELAFPVIREILERYVKDREQPHSGAHFASLSPSSPSHPYEDA